MIKHDIAHKEFYSHPENVKDLIQGFVALDCVAEFDFDTLERDNDSFVEKEKNERHDDIIWRLKWRDRWVYVYILIEFQHKVDKAMPVRIMSYVSLLYLNLLNNKKLNYGKRKKLPVVLPIVLYNGQSKWTAKRNIQDMVEKAPDEMAMYVPKLSYYFIDEIHPEANKKDSVLDGLANSVAAIMKLQRTLSSEEFYEFINKVKKLIKDEKQKQKFETFITFLLRYLSSAYDKPEYEKVRDLEEVIRMVKTFRDFDREKDREVFIKKGEKKGEKKGKLGAFYDMIKKGRITLEEAALDIGITVEKLLADFKEYNLVI